MNERLERLRVARTGQPFHPGQRLVFTEQALAGMVPQTLPDGTIVHLVRAPGSGRRLPSPAQVYTASTSRCEPFTVRLAQTGQVYPTHLLEPAPEEA